MATEIASTVTALLRRDASEFGDRDFLVTDQGFRLTYADADRASRDFARRLISAGIGKGSRVAAQFSYGPEWVVTWLAINRVGAIHIPFSTAYKPRELWRALRHSDAQLFLSPGRLFGLDRQAYLEGALPSLAGSGRDKLLLAECPFLRAIWMDGAAGADWATQVNVLVGTETDAVPDSLMDELESEVTPADLAIGIYTSGSTGEPKGVLHTHGALVRKGRTLAKILGLTREDRVFCGSPFFWIGGIGSTILPAMTVGATLLCAEKPEAVVSLDLMERERATDLQGWPAVVGPIIRHSTAWVRDIPALQEHRYYRPELRASSLGMTETVAHHTHVTNLPSGFGVPDDIPGVCVGEAVPGFQHRIVDPTTGDDVAPGQPGTLLVRGSELTVGLIKREREQVFSPDGWYDTGDQCCIRDGIMYFLGRLNDMIKTSGNNVAPEEVEACLRSLPAVDQAYVVGVSDPERAEIVAAVVVPAKGATIDPEALRAMVRTELSNYKVPRRIEVWSSAAIPSLPTGKIDKRAIRRLLEGSPDETRPVGSVQSASLDSAQ